MSTSTPSADPAELLERWLSHRELGGELPGRDVDRSPAAATDPPDPVAVDAPSAVEAGRIVLEAFAAQLRDPAGSDLDAPHGPGSAVSADLPVPAPAPDLPDVPPGAASVPAQDPPAPRHPSVTPASSGSVTTPPRRGARRALTLLTLLALAGAVAAGATTWGERTTTTGAIAVGLLLLTWLLHALRRRTTGTEVSLVDGVLKVRQGTSVHRWPVTPVHPPIDIIGAPGDRGWKVLVQRKGMAPFVITRRMVDPQELTDAIRVHRPHA